MGAALQRGSILYDQRRYKQAVSEFQRELETSPENEVARAMLALSLLYSGEPREAWLTVKRLLGEAPEYAFGFYAAAHVAIKYAIKEKRWYDFGSEQVLKVQAARLERAKRFINEAIRLLPTNASFFATYAMIEAALGWFGSSLEAADRGLALDPNHLECRRLRAKALLLVGGWAEAEQTIDAAISLNPESSVIHLARGWHRMAAGDRSRAEDHFREALRRNPNDKRALLALRNARAARFLPYRKLLQFLLWASNGLLRQFIAMVIAFGIIGAGAFRGSVNVRDTAIFGAAGLAFGILAFRPMLIVFFMFQRASRKRIPVRHCIISLLILFILGNGCVARFRVLSERERLKHVDSPSRIRYL